MSSPNALTSTQDSQIFNKYKPLRNTIRKLGLSDSLKVIHVYAQNLQLDKEFPPDIEVIPAYSNGSDQQKKQWITEFHLETLCREIILHADETESCPKSLRQWKTLAQAINKLKELAEFIAERYVDPDLFQQELYRMAHQQLPWQMSQVQARNFTRYFMVYKYSPLSKIIESATTLSIEKIFIMGMALLGYFLDHPAIFYPMNSQIPGLTNEDFDKFLQHFSKDLGDLKTRLNTEKQMNEKFFYAYHSLRAFPLIRMPFSERESLVCPLPTILFWRITSGMYYEICKEDGFAHAFGEAFQEYVGEVLKRGTTLERTNIHPESEYQVGKDRKRTVDWIMDQDDASLFIEVKTKRLVVKGKSEIGQQETLSLELDKLARIVVQLYKTILDYKEGHYPDYPFFRERVIFPIVVTLEEWFLIGSRLRKELDSKVSDYMNQERISITYLQDMPYTVCSVREIEMAVQVMDKAGIHKVMSGKVFDVQRREWELSGHIRDAFAEYESNSQFLFEEEFKNLNIDFLTAR